MSISALFARQYAEALSAAEAALAINPHLLAITTNQAHALLFLNRFEEARAVYLKQPDQVVDGGGKTFRQDVLEDFKALRQHGLKHPDMAKIEKLLQAGSANTAH